MTPPLLLICMGTAGSGKSTLAHHLSDALAWPTLEADDFHNRRNRNRMAQGMPLDDRDREPWMRAICERLVELHGEGQSIILAHSGLRRKHREQLRQCGFDTRFLWLTAPSALIEQRIAHRKGHFMPPSLLPSQLAALEPPESEPDVQALDVTAAPEVVLSEALRSLEASIGPERLVSCKALESVE